MRKFCFAVLVLFLFASVNLVQAKTIQPTSLNTTSGYYDPDSGITIAAAFEIGSDGSLREIPLDDFVAQLKAGKAVEKI